MVSLAMMSLPPSCPKSDSYEDVKRTIYRLCYQFSQRYRLDYEELIAECHIAFMQAYHSYNPAKTKFNTWIYFCVWCHLRELIRTRTRRTLKVKRVDIPLDEVKDRHTITFNPDDWQFSPDARLVINVVLDPPVDVLLETGGKTTPKQLGRGLTKFLQDIGWPQARIDRAFQEVGDMLSDS